jgi:hypothetical protein
VNREGKKMQDATRHAASMLHRCLASVLFAEGATQANEWMGLGARKHREATVSSSDIPSCSLLRHPFKCLDISCGASDMAGSRSIRICNRAGDILLSAFV